MRAAIVAIVAAFASCGCGLIPVRYVGDHPPRYVAPAAQLPVPGIALVLSGGGPRGFAHLGVIRALEESGIRPELIVGSSAGALVGALYALGKSPAEIERIAKSIDPRALIDFAWFRGGVLGHALTEFVEQAVEGRRIEQLPVRFAAVATRLDDGAPVIFNAGATSAAVRASAATQDSWIGRILPLLIDGECYVDGDIAAPLPVRSARSLGARFVIAVDVSARLEQVPPGAERYRSSDVARQRRIAADSVHADIVIHPDIGYWTSMSAQYRDAVIEMGYREAKKSVPAIESAMRQLPSRLE